MNRSSPLLICLTATRNYGWITRAFLKANSLWADYIIVVDQVSTDGTQQMCLEYDNVILIENTDLTYSETTRSTIAINRAREIKGDKILVYLAIDEVLPANWMSTEDGQRIIHSSPGEMFLLSWANFLPDNKHYKATFNDNYYRVFHDDDFTVYDNEGKDMHTHCLPYCKTGKEFIVHDFPIVHFGYYNTLFQTVKQWYYYQMVDYDKNHRSVVSLSRFYRKRIDNEYSKGDFEINPDWLWGSFDIFSLIDVTQPPFFWKEMERFINQRGVNYYRSLDIWDQELLNQLHLKDPRLFPQKVLHKYLHATEKVSKAFFFRAIDSVLKKIV